MPNAQALEGPGVPLQQVLGQPFRPYFDCQSMHRSSTLQGCQLVVDMAKNSQAHDTDSIIQPTLASCAAVRRRAPDLRVARHWRGRRGACICNKMQAGPGGRARWRAPGPGARWRRCPASPARRPPPGAAQRPPPGGASLLGRAAPRALGPAPGSRPAPQHPRFGHAPGLTTFHQLHAAAARGARRGGGGGGWSRPRRAGPRRGWGRRGGAAGGAARCPGGRGRAGGALGGAAARGAGPVLRPALPGRAAPAAAPASPVLGCIEKRCGAPWRPVLPRTPLPRPLRFVPASTLLYSQPWSLAPGCCHSFRTANR